jgi:Flp pilus assembly protein TadG
VRLRRSVPGRRGPNDRGVASVEFALVVPLLVLLLFGLVVAGSVYLDQLNLQSAARNAARAGSISSATACTTAQTELAAQSVGNLQCKVLSTCSTGGFRVELKANRTVTIPLLGDRDVNLTATSTFSCSA